jgi:hypothetical protein
MSSLTLGRGAWYGGANAQVCCELQRLRLEGLDNDETRVRMFEAIRLRGLLRAYDKLAEKIREIEKEPAPCQQKRIA